MKLISWNVNGLRSIQKKGLEEFLLKEDPDIFCAQEIKVNEKEISLIPKLQENYLPFFSSAKKRGYSGVLSAVKYKNILKPENTLRGIGNKQFDEEGRFVITEHKNFTLYNTYFPSGSSGLERQNFKYSFLNCFYNHIAGLPKSEQERIIICGDINICHREIDIHHPETAAKKEMSGFLPEERSWIDRFLALGFVDSFRLINGEKENIYSWWTYRAGARPKNLGWRIDYFFVSKKLAKKVIDAQILTNIDGSDHCPISLTIKA